MDELAISELEKLKYIYFLACIFYISGNESGGCKAMYRTLLARCGSAVLGVWPRWEMYRTLLARCEYRVCSHCVTIIVCHFHDTHTLQARCGTFLSSAICNEKSTWVGKSAACCCSAALGASRMTCVGFARISESQDFAESPDSSFPTPCTTPSIRKITKKLGMAHL